MWHEPCVAADVTGLAAMFTPLCLLVACDSDRPREFARLSNSGSHEVTIVEPMELSSIRTEAVDALGRPIRISCASCHSLREEAAVPESADELTEFHTGLVFQHGSNRCASCHVAEPRSAPKLRLADGRVLPMVDAIQLCAQCHGPQHRDYLAGAHGGMSGAWSLASGPRTRNHCVSCHDPHAPKYLKVKPASRAHDRLPIDHEATPQ